MPTWEERWIDRVMGHVRPREAKTYAKSIAIQRAAEVVRAFVSPVDLSFLLEGSAKRSGK